MSPVFKPTVDLKICGDLPQRSIRGLELDPEPFTIPFNQIYLKSGSVLRDSGVAFGPSALLRAEFDYSIFEVSTQTSATE